MKRLIIFSMIFILGASVQAQTQDRTDIQKKQKRLPKSIEFPDLFKQDMSKKELDELKREREARLRERFSQIDALEGVVDPDNYIVGPGDVFSFNVWGGIELQLPVTVSAGGKLSIPSIGDIDVAGESLSSVREKVISRASEAYANSRVTITLERLRFFRVHVVGEVRYPGTFIAQAVDRVSGLIQEAGGVTEWAWTGKIEIRHVDGRRDFFDLDRFNQSGDLRENIYVTGGDIIVVPQIPLDGGLVRVEGDLELSGIYPIFNNEKILDFLTRIRALSRKMEITKIMVVRSAEGAQKFFPFSERGRNGSDFIIKKGDRIVLPSQYVYVKGAVQRPGAYPYAMNLKAIDYAGMAGGDFRSGNVKSIKVYHVRTGESQKGPDVVVEPGDVVHLNPSLWQRLSVYITIIPTITSLILAAKAAGFFGK